MPNYTTYQCPVCEEIEFQYTDDDDLNRFIIEHLEAHLENRERKYKRKVE